MAVQGQLDGGDSSRRLAPPGSSTRSGKKRTSTSRSSNASRSKSRSKASTRSHKGKSSKRRRRTRRTQSKKRSTKKHKPSKMSGSQRHKSSKSGKSRKSHKSHKSHKARKGHHKASHGVKASAGVTSSGKGDSQRQGVVVKTHGGDGKHHHRPNSRHLVCILIFLTVVSIAFVINSGFLTFMCFWDNKINATTYFVLTAMQMVIIFLSAEIVSYRTRTLCKMALLTDLLFILSAFLYIYLKENSMLAMKPGDEQLEPIRRSTTFIALTSLIMVIHLCTVIMAISEIPERRGDIYTTTAVDVECRAIVPPVDAEEKTFISKVLECWKRNASLLGKKDEVPAAFPTITVESSQTASTEQSGTRTTAPVSLTMTGTTPPPPTAMQYPQPPPFKPRPSAEQIVIGKAPSPPGAVAPPQMAPPPPQAEPPAKQLSQTSPIAAAATQASAENPALAVKKSSTTTAMEGSNTAVQTAESGGMKYLYERKPSTTTAVEQRSSSTLP